MLAQTVMLEGVAFAATTPPATNATEAEINAGRPNFRIFTETIDNDLILDPFFKKLLLIELSGNHQSECAYPRLHQVQLFG